MIFPYYSAFFKFHDFSMHGTFFVIPCLFLPLSLYPSYTCRGYFLGTEIKIENRGSYMSAHVLLNLLNELGKRDKM